MNGVFNEWRERYGKMSYAEMRAFYDRMEEIYPNQEYTDRGSIRKFLDMVEMETEQPIRVVEVGGWKGELGDHMMSGDDRIVEWLNIEVIQKALSEPVCKRDGYWAAVPPDYMWNVGWRYGIFNTAILGHVIEHIKAAELVRMLDVLKVVKFIYVEAPIRMKTKDVNWYDYLGTHVLEIGMEEVECLFLERWFDCVY